MSVSTHSPQGNGIQDTRRQVLNIISITMSLLSLVVGVSALGRGWSVASQTFDITMVDWTYVIVPALAFFSMLFVLLVSDRWDNLRVSLLVLTFVMYGFFLLWGEGEASFGLLLLIVAGVLAALLMEEVPALLWIIGIAISAAFVIGIKLNLIGVFNESDLEQRRLWMMNLVLFYVSLASVSVALILLSRSYRWRNSWLESEMLALGAEKARLEKQAQHTATAYQALEKRDTLLNTLGIVSRLLLQFIDYQAFLPNAVRLIAEYLDLYNVNIYLMDEKREWLVLRAASSARGKRLLAQGHNWRVRTDSVVGYVAYTGRARLAVEGEENLQWDRDSDMPELRLELVLPLLDEERIVGVLSLQSTKPDTFFEGSVPILQNFAVHLATMLKNVTMFHERELALTQLRESFGLETSRGWEKRAIVGFRYTPLEMRPLLKYQHTEQVTSSLQRIENNGLLVPLKYVGRTMGVLKLHRDESHPWTDEEIGFIEQASETIVRALENARLLEDARRRAERDRIFNEVATQLRASLDLDWILKNTVQELGRVLGAEVTAIKLLSPAEVEGNDGEQQLSA